MIFTSCALQNSKMESRPRGERLATLCCVQSLRTGLACLPFMIVFLMLLSSSSAHAQGEIEDPLAIEKPAAALTANLSVEELSGSASYAEGAHTIRLTVVNNGKRGLLLDGDNARMSFAAVSETPLPLEQIIKPPTKKTLPGDLLEVGTSIGTGGVMPVSVDAVNKTRNPGPAFYGKDEKRRDLAELRFGKRLVFPGETSTGEIYLDRAGNSSGQICIQVFAHPGGTALGTLTLAISPYLAGAAEKDKAAQKKVRVRSTEFQRLPGELEKSLEKREKTGY